MWKVFWYKLRNLPYLLRSLRVPIGAYVGRLGGAVTAYGKLQMSLIDVDGTRYDYGTVGYKVVTTSGVNYLALAFSAQYGCKAEDFNYHASGTGTLGEYASNTVLGTEVTDSARPAGTRIALASTGGGTGSAYRTIGTIAYTSSHSITEHGLFNQVTVAGSTMWDRTVFTAVSVTNGQSLQFAYQLAINSGG